MKNCNAIISFCLLATFILAGSPSVAGSLTTFEAETFSANNYARDVEHFTVGIDSFIVLACYNGSSQTYKWDGSTYTLSQTLHISAYDAEFFTIGTNAYLAMADPGNDSVIFQWDATGDGNGGEGTGAFEVYQTITTHDARDWEFFTIGSDSFLAVANHSSGTNYAIDSVIYKWGTDDQFAVYQNIATVGALDWESFTIGTDVYLAVANHRNTNAHTINSILYRWNGLLFEEIQAIPTQGAFDWEFFTMGGDSFLAVANHYDGGYLLNSKIYKWNGTTFADFQSLATNAATDWNFFSLANEAFLVVTNYGGNNTQILKYDGTTFTLFQNIPNTYSRASAFFTRGSESYLAVALASSTPSKLYKANLTPDPTAVLHEVTPCPGQSVTLSLDVWGDQPITYQWQFLDENLAGATEPTYTIPAMGRSDEGTYQCVVSNAHGTGISNAQTLTQIPPILLEEPPNEINSCQGETVTFGLVASGLNLNYQWHFNGTSIPDATYPTYTLENITTANEGAYTCDISDVCTTLTTEPASLSVNSSDWIQLDLTQDSILERGQLTIPINISGLNGALIQAFSVSLSYDANLFTFHTLRTYETLAENWSVLSNATDSSVVVSGGHSEPLSGDGVLVKLIFDVIDTGTEGCGEIAIENGLFNDDAFCLAPVVGTYCVCLKGDVTQSSTITALDASQVLRHMVGVPTTPSELLLCNADATCNGTITPLDAVRILEYSVGRIETFCGASAKGTIGDVTLTLPEQTLTKSDQLTIPLVLGDTTGLEIKGLVFTLDYDSLYLDITELEPTDGLMAGLDWRYEINTSESGQVTVAAAGATALTGSGTLLNLVGTVRQWGQTELEVTELAFNEGQPNAILTEAPTSYRILAIEPRSVARGLGTPQFEVVGCCDLLELEWRHPELDLVLLGNPLILDPPPQHSTYYEARITNPITLETMVRRAQVLVPVFPFSLDYNGDGFNSLEDLYMLLPDWGQALDIDPNGDGFLDIRDLLYINVTGE